MSGCLSGLRERSAKPCFVGSNPTPDSTLIYLPMDRKLRRELSKRKWISRAKKVYNSCGKFSERHDESIYFDSDEEMEGWLESFRQEFGKPFIYIE